MTPLDYLMLIIGTVYSAHLLISTRNKSILTPEEALEWKRRNKHTLGEASWWEGE